MTSAWSYADRRFRFAWCPPLSPRGPILKPSRRPRMRYVTKVGSGWLARCSSQASARSGCDYVLQDTWDRRLWARPPGFQRMEVVHVAVASLPNVAKRLVWQLACGMEDTCHVCKRKRRPGWEAHMPAGHKTSVRRRAIMVNAQARAWLDIHASLTTSVRKRAVMWTHMDPHTGKITWLMK